MLNRTKKVYAVTITFWYLAQFIGAVAVINLYSDIERLTPCADTGDLADPEKSSEVYDLVFVLLGIFHMVEWVRYTILLTVVCIGVNVTVLWYITIPNTIYGLIAYAITHMVYFSDDGSACSDKQQDRATWILVEIISFWVLYFLFVFPFIWTIFLGKDRAYATLVEWKEAGDQEDEEE